VSRSLRARRAGWIALIVAIGWLAGAGRQAGAQSSVVISIVGTNDLHGAVTGADGFGGLPLFGGFLRNLRAARAADGGVLLVDAGDLFQGTLESNLNEGAVVVSAYNALGYAAATIGNHEFDFGPVGPQATPRAPSDDPRGALKARAAEARFPFLTDNIIDQATGRPVQWPNVHPSTVVDVAGVRVGLIGVSTEVTLQATISMNTQGLGIAPLAPAIATEAARLRSAGAAVVVVLAHAGGRCTRFDDPADLSSCGADEEIFRVASELPAGMVDVIVAGHRHEGVAHTVAGIAIMSSYWRGRAFGRVDLTVDRQSTRILGRRQFPPRELCPAMHSDGRCASASDSTAVPATYEGQPVIADAAVAAILAPAIAKADEQRNEPLGVAVTDAMPRATSEETPLGNLVADWTRGASGRADLAIVNGGGVRAPLPAGPITYGRLFEVMPFDNRQATIVITGAELRRVIAANLQRRGSIILLSGVRATARCDGDSLRVDVHRDSGRLVRDRDRLRVATMDFLATGGDDILTPIQPLTVEGDYTSTPIVRDEVAAWMKKRRRTWSAAELLGPRNRRLVYPGERPVSCP
jgi:2',3'-cyclic-nucleotide 2'-phosphodiesterase (5'-nucleotidase family)